MNRILFTFPGQGAQIPGMLHELDRVISCKHWFDRGR